MTIKEINNLIEEVVTHKQEKVTIETETTIYVVEYFSSLKEITCWAENGLMALADVSTAEDNETATKELFQAIMNFERGYIVCSECEKPIKISEIAGHYFAGSYCKDCWENRYKELARGAYYD